MQLFIAGSSHSRCLLRCQCERYLVKPLFVHMYVSFMPLGQKLLFRAVIATTTVLRPLYGTNCVSHFVESYFSNISLLMVISTFRLASIIDCNRPTGSRPKE